MWLAHEFIDQETTKPTKAIEPSLDPHTLDLFDPRNPINKRRRGDAGIRYSVPY